MDTRRLKQVCWIVAFGCFLASVTFARTDTLLIGSAIPLLFPLPHSRFVTDTDTLYLNGRLLARDSDYRLAAGANALDLSLLPHGIHDTLRVVFHDWPSWAFRTIGRPIPDVSSPTPPVQPPAATPTASSAAPLGEGMTLSGAKSFRFSSRTSGTSEFGQSLDLRISGELSPGLELSGAISDRGYDPSYGTSNSRLNELDKISLQLKSSHVQASVGDIALMNAQRPVGKQVSGLSLALSYPLWRARAAIARPRGRFQSAQFQGLDGFQGPYQLLTGSRIAPVVPGSETVWLDGERLDRGADKDYSIDYPTGQITLGSRHPVDHRSRFEVDFEPQSGDYRMELAEAGTEIQTHDSVFAITVAAAREGDDKNQPLGADLSDADRQVLGNAGDGVAARSGVVRDTAGDYALDIVRLPDSVYRYVGRGNGAYRVTFSYVGPKQGTYSFLGGNNYRFVGKDSGDYLPVVALAKPTRLDSYRALLALKPSKSGVLSLDYRRTEYNSNLFSNLAAARQQGQAYDALFTQHWQLSGHDNWLSVNRRSRQASYHSRERFDPVDLSRDFLVPSPLDISSTSELSHLITASLTSAPFLTIQPSYATLSLGNGFDSRTGGARLILKPLSRLTSTISWRGINATQTADTVSRKGRATNSLLGVAYEFNSTQKCEAGLELDSRETHYFSVPQGTRFTRAYASFTTGHESARYELYQEDSLLPSWTQDLRRQRLSARSARVFGEFRYDVDASYQWLRQPSSAQGNFLCRVNVNYTSTRHNFSVNSMLAYSEELRRERGISYLEVPTGRGSYILDNGRYVPDPDGNFIQVEELLSAQSRVQRTEKNFQFSKNWHDAELHLSAEIHEELLPSGRSSWLRVLPFYSPENEPYLYFAKRYDASVRLIRWRTFYALSIQGSEDFERRQLGPQATQRRDQKLQVQLKEPANRLLLDQTLDLFRSRRDNYYTGAGDINGFKLAAGARQTTDGSENGVNLSFRDASSALHERARLYALTLDSRIRMNTTSEFCLSAELYRQLLDTVGTYPSYQLTDNHFGARGAIWSTSLNYRVKQGMRISINVADRISDDRAARVTARGEFVTEF